MSKRNLQRILLTDLLSDKKAPGRTVGLGTDGVAAMAEIIRESCATSSDKQLINNQTFKFYFMSFALLRGLHHTVYLYTVNS